MARSYTDWMGKLNDSLPLKSLLIPGTHDSGAFKATSNPGGLVIAQDWNFRDQMDHGIRFFDLRLSENLNFFHDKYFLQSNMNDFMNSAKSFLSAHPKEGLIIQIKRENCDNDKLFNENLCGLINENKSLFIWSGIPKTVSALRGKILVLIRHTYYNPCNLIWYDGNTIFDRDVNGENFRVQDCYDVLDSSKTVTQRAERKAHWIRETHDYSINNQNSWVINFMSHKGLFAATISDMAYAVRKACNLQLTIKSHGIMVMDFPNGDNGRYIEMFIDKNYEKDKVNLSNNLFAANEFVESNEVELMNSELPVECDSFENDDFVYEPIEEITE